MRLSEVYLFRTGLISWRLLPFCMEAAIMLILTRRLGDSLLVGDNIIVTVVNVDRNQVRISVDAPEDVLVLRKELVEKVDKHAT